MQQFIYPAVIYEDENEFKVFFPDLDISSSGDSFEDAFMFGKDLLRVYFLYALNNDIDFALPSDFLSISKKCTEKEIPILIDAIVTDVDLKAFKKN